MKRRAEFFYGAFACMLSYLYAMTLAYLFHPAAGDDPSPGMRSSADGGVGEGHESRRPVLHLVESDDHGLVAQLRTGDRAALETIFRAYYPELLRFASALLRRKDNAADVVHDVFAAIIKHPEQWHVTSSVRAYLFRATRNRVLTVHRHTSREEARIARMAATEDDALRIGSTSEDSARRGDVDPEVLEKAVEQALAELSPALRQIVALRWEHGLSFAEVAEVVGTSDVAARKQASRALAMLRQKVRMLIE